MVLGLFLEKFIIKLEDNNEIQASYNPNTLQMSYSANWQDKGKKDNNVPEQQFTNIQGTTLSVTLMFDTYNKAIDTINDLKLSKDKDVSEAYIKKLVSLVRIDGKKHRPPICTLKWGKMKWGSKLPFKCVLSSLNVSYTMFLADGTPVRATADCTFNQWRDAKEDEKSVNTNSPDVYKVHVVQRGETLSSIAHKHFNSPMYWRYIATANKITNPLLLEPGRVLTIPTLKPEER